MVVTSGVRHRREADSVLRLLLNLVSRKILFPTLFASPACLPVNLELDFHFPSWVFKTALSYNCCHVKTSRSREESPISHLSPCAFASFQWMCGSCCNQKVYKELWVMMTHETMFRVCPTFMCLDAKTFDRMLDPPHFVSIVRVGKPKPKDKCVAFISWVKFSKTALSYNRCNVKILRTWEESPFSYLLVPLPHCNACVVSPAIRKCVRNCQRQHMKQYLGFVTFMCLDAKIFDMHEKFAAIHIGRWFCLASCNMLVFRCQNLWHACRVAAIQIGRWFCLESWDLFFVIA